MALQQGIRERCQVLREAHRLQHIEVLQKLRDRCRERMDRPGEREIRELMGKRVEQDDPEYRAFRNSAKKHPDNLSGRLSRAKWSCWPKRVLGDKVDSCFHQAWGSDEEWDGIDEQQGKPYCYCTDHATIEFTRLAPCDLRVRIIPIHLLTDLLEQRPDIDAGAYLQINQSNEKKLRQDTGAMCHEQCLFATNAMSALAYCSKCTNSDHRLTPMTHVDKSSPPCRHLRYFCHTCSAIHCTLPLRSLDDCPVPDELFQNNILDPRDPRLSQHLTREDFDYWLRQLPLDKSPGDDVLTFEMWQEAPAEMKDALYQVVNQVIQNGKMPTSWEGALTTLISKKVGEEKILESIRLICLMNTAIKIVTSVWAKRLSKSLELQKVLQGSQEGFWPDRSTRRRISRFISALQDVERNQGTICVTFLDFENYFHTISLPALFLLLCKFGMNENDVQALKSYYEHLHMRVIHQEITLVYICRIRMRLYVIKSLNDIYMSNNF